MTEETGIAGVARATVTLFQMKASAIVSLSYDDTQRAQTSIVQTSVIRRETGWVNVTVSAWMGTSKMVYSATTRLTSIQTALSGSSIPNPSTTAPSVPLGLSSTLRQFAVNVVFFRPSPQDGSDFNCVDGMSSSKLRLCKQCNKDFILEEGFCNGFHSTNLTTSKLPLWLRGTK